MTNGRDRVRLRLKGIASATKKLADGSVRKYYYAWRGGPLLAGKPGSPEFLASYNVAVAERVKKPAPPAATVKDLIDKFKASTDFTGKSEDTRRNYNLYLALIEAKFGTMPIAALEDPRCRGDFKEWRDSFSAKPRKADYIWQTLARVFSHAKDNGRIKTNPCERGGRLYSSDRAEKVWSDAQLDTVLKVAPKHMILPIVLAEWTGQREGDLLDLPWAAYDGKYIRLKQNKTGRRVEIPVGAPLKAILDGMTRTDGTILLTHRGKRKWTSDGFRSSWDKLMERAGMADVDLHFHDLRGTAVTRLAVAGCTIPEIAAITGHSPDEAAKILDAHYLGRDKRLADGAIEKLEKLRAK
jgi:integrase